ncbi:uncharacterized protein LOC144708408 isoform X2 [Wolffia australiana]
MSRSLSRAAAVGESAAEIGRLRRRAPPWAAALSPRVGHVRWRSGGSGKFAQVFELVVEEGGRGGAGAASSESGAARRLEELIHGILVRRSAPDWLPFVPGSSYWVPPRTKSYKLVEALEKVSAPMTDEEVMSLTTAWGWPCASHLVDDLSTESEDNKNRTHSSEGEES